MKPNAPVLLERILRSRNTIIEVQQNYIDIEHDAGNEVDESGLCVRRVSLQDAGIGSYN